MIPRPRCISYIDMDEEAVRDISDYVTHAVQLDATDETSIRA